MAIAKKGSNTLDTSSAHVIPDTDAEVHKSSGGSRRKLTRYRSDTNLASAILLSLARDGSPSPRLLPMSSRPIIPHMPLLPTPQTCHKSARESSFNPKVRVAPTRSAPTKVQQGKVSLEKGKRSPIYIPFNLPEGRPLAPAPILPRVKAGEIVR